MSQFISFARGVGQSSMSHTTFAAAAVMTNHKYSQVTGFLNRVAIFNSNKDLHSRAHNTNSNSVSYRNYTIANTNTPTSPSSAPRNNLPRCSGMTARNTPCQRDGINLVTESPTSANKDSKAVVRYYCYQHDPRLAVSRRCLGYVASEHRQCRLICSESEIRTGGRPICNRHYHLGARLVARRN
ncbi:hypothetical protein KI688_005899 [Linnemannia hyalina]|uniref:Uncharacterized protein n=1 Tax=Linnemannia hyalina TaxID=64524 RepID=A0A9P7Y5G7_9FUNG|nr:hypothetical protein KI688_005899 [Linnemannia hyalina]